MIGNEFERLRFNALRNKGGASTGGYLYGWGVNRYGELGLGHKDVVEKPTLITEFNTLGMHSSTRNIRAINYVINGKLYTAGNNYEYNSGLGTNVGENLELTQINGWDNWEMVCISPKFSVGLRAGKLYSWGSNENGYTGQGTTSRYTTEITQIGTDEDWVEISSGHNYTIARKSNGEVWGWGDSINYQLSVSSSSNNPNPVRIPNIDNYDKLATGFQDSFIIKDGKLYGWGSNSTYVLGLNTYGKKRVTRIGSYSDWDWISTYQVSAGIRSGEIYFMGNTRDINGKYNNTPTNMNIGNDWAKVYINEYNMYAIKNDGTLWGMGQNNNGALGLGHSINQKGVLNQIGTDNDWIDLKVTGSTILATKASKIKE